MEEKVYPSQFDFWLARIGFMLFFAVDLMTIPIVTQFIIVKEYHLNTENSSGITVSEIYKVCPNQTSMDENVDVTAKESRISTLVMYMNIGELLPSAFLTFFIGAWSDATKRRLPLLWIPAAGNIIYMLFLLMDFYLERQDYYLIFTGALIAGSTGGGIVFITGFASYIADTTADSGRTFHFSSLEATMAAVMGLSNMLFGYWLNYSGFSGPLYFMLIVSIASTTVCFLMKETNASSPASFDVIMKHVSSTLKFMRPGDKSSTCIFVYILAFEIYFFIHSGEERTNVLFLQTTPLCFDTVQTGWWMFLQGLVSTFGSSIVVQFSSPLGGDMGMSYLGMLSRAAQSLIMAFAATTAMAFFAIPAMVAQLLPLSIIRSMASKTVNSDEYGSLFGCMHGLQSIASFLGPISLTAIMAVTGPSYHGVTYLICAFMTILPAILIGVASRLRVYEETIPLVSEEQSSYNGSSHKPID